jgi:hypothetical protein
MGIKGLVVEKCQQSKMRTEDAATWYKQLNIGVATFLLINLIPFLAAVWNKDYGKTSMTLIRNDTVTTTGDVRFNIAAAFSLASAICALGHIWISVFPGAVIRMVLKGTNPYRWGMLLLSLPTLHVALLFGVANVSNVWAFFASTSVTMGLLTVVYLVEAVEETIRRVWPTFLMGMFYLTFWAFAWWTGDRRNPLALACVTITIAGILCIFLFYRPRTKTGHLRREACLTIGMAILHVGGMWLWVAAQATVFLLAPWSALCAIVLVATGTSAFAFDRIRHISFDTEFATLGTELLENSIIIEEPANELENELVELHG